MASAATEVSNDGFRANWSAVEGATYYEVVTLSDYKIPESGTFVLDDETFDKVTTGTVSSPVYNDVQCNLNKYTNYPDWYGITTLLAEGMIGLKTIMRSWVPTRCFTVRYTRTMLPIRVL